MGSEKFDGYYKAQFPWMSAEEFTVFTQTLQEKLPVTFRVNQTEVNHETVCEMFTDKQFIDKHQHNMVVKVKDDTTNEN